MQMSTSNSVIGLKAALQACHWKSVLFYSEQILDHNPDNFDALFARSYALCCCQRHSELEQWMSSLPLGTLQEPRLLAIRCKGLQVTKQYAKIVGLLGGESDSSLITTPVLSVQDVTRSGILKEIRDDALFNLVNSDDFSRSRKSGQATKADDPLSPNRTIDAIGKSLTTGNSQFLEPFAVLTDSSTQNDPFILSACGCLRLLNDQGQGAEALFLKALEENPDCEIAWLCLIWAYMARAEWDQGLSTLRKVNRRFPSSESVSMFAMSLHLRSGTPILAWNWISQADGDNVFVRHERGVALLMDGDTADAIQDFVAVIQSTTENDLLRAANLNLGHCHRKSGDFRKAIECYEKALAFPLKESEPLASIGFTYHLIGDYDRAILYYNNALAVDPVHPFATRMLEIAVQNHRT
jgi:anaphase-promoting complex subunit 6